MRNEGTSISSRLVMKPFAFNAIPRSSRQAKVQSLINGVQVPLKTEEPKERHDEVDRIQTSLKLAWRTWELPKKKDLGISRQCLPDEVMTIEDGTLPLTNCWILPDGVSYIARAGAEVPVPEYEEVSTEQSSMSMMMSSRCPL